MTEERITTVETEAPAGASTATQGGTTRTTVIRDNDSSSGGAGWLIALALILSAIAGIYLFSQSSSSEIARNDAIAEAADEVGNAAGAVGDAAGQVGEAVDNAADNLTR